MNMKCAICGSDKFHLDIENQTLSCSACSFYCDFKALVRGSAAPHAQAQPQRPAYNPADFEIVGGVLKKYKGAAVDVVVPDGVLEIGVHAFKEMHYIKSIKLPDGLRVIGREAFSCCRNLERINIPSSVESFGVSYGQKWSGSDIVRTEYYGCFDGCNNLIDISYPTDKFDYAVFNGSKYYFDKKEKERIEWERKKEQALLRGVCPRCNSKLGMFKRCNTCKFNWK